MHRSCLIRDSEIFIGFSIIFINYNQFSLQIFIIDYQVNILDDIQKKIEILNDFYRDYWKWIHLLTTFDYNLFVIIISISFYIFIFKTQILRDFIFCFCNYDMFDNDFQDSSNIIFGKFLWKIIISTMLNKNFLSIPKNDDEAYTRTNAYKRARN